MVDKVRQVAPVRGEVQGGARRYTEQALEVVEKECPREWAPVDSPQVPAGEGRLEHHANDEDPIVKVGARLQSIRKSGEGEPLGGTRHTGMGRRREEELMTMQWFGGSDATIGPSSLACAPVTVEAYSAFLK